MQFLQIVALFLLQALACQADRLSDLRRHKPNYKEPRSRTEPRSKTRRNNRKKGKMVSEFLTFDKAQVKKMNSFLSKEQRILSGWDHARTFDGLTSYQQKKVIAAKKVFTPHEKERICTFSGDDRICLFSGRKQGLVRDIFKKLDWYQQYATCQDDKKKMKRNMEEWKDFAANDRNWYNVFADTYYLKRMGLEWEMDTYDLKRIHPDRQKELHVVSETEKMLSSNLTFDDAQMEKIREHMCEKWLIPHDTALKVFDLLTRDEQNKVIAAKIVFTPLEVTMLQEKCSGRSFEDMEPWMQYLICQTDKVTISNSKSFRVWKTNWRRWYRSSHTETEYLNRMGLTWVFDNRLL